MVRFLCACEIPEEAMVNELPQDCAHVVSTPHMGDEAVRALTGILEATTPDSRLQIFNNKIQTPSYSNCFQW